VLHANESWKKSRGPKGQRLFEFAEKNREDDPATLEQGFSDLSLVLLTFKTIQPSNLPLSRLCAF